MRQPASVRGAMHRQHDDLMVASCCTITPQRKRLNLLLCTLIAFISIIISPSSWTQCVSGHGTSFAPIYRPFQTVNGIERLRTSVSSRTALASSSSNAEIDTAGDYHTYAELKQRLTAWMNDAHHAPVLRLVRSKEKTIDGQHIDMIQMSNWYKQPRASRDVQASDAASLSSLPLSALPGPSDRHHQPKRKLRILFTFGEHAREFVSMESAIHLIDSLLSGSRDYRERCDVASSGEFGEGEGSEGEDADRARMHGSAVASSPGFRARFAQFVLDHAELHIIPILNPDGRLHIERSILRHATQSKSQKPAPAPNYCWRNISPRRGGVDLNRNAAWEFGGPGSTSERHSEEFRGEHPFSEVESRFVRDAQLQFQYDAYVSVHSGEQQLFIPFVDTVSKRTRRRRASTEKELAMCHRIAQHASLNGWLRESGIGYEMNDYSADGTLFDWMSGAQNVSNVFCVELWGGPQHPDCFVQFNPNPTRRMQHSYPRSKTPKQQSDLEVDLRRMHVFYVRLLTELIEAHMGVRFEDFMEASFVNSTKQTDSTMLTTPVPLSPSERRQQASIQSRRLCEVEQQLYAQRLAAFKDGAIDQTDSARGGNIVRHRWMSGQSLMNSAESRTRVQWFGET